MFGGSSNNISRVFMIMGAVLLSWGLYKLNEVGNPTEIEIESRVETAYRQELARMEQAQLNELARRKDELDSMSPEQKAVLLVQASQPITLTAEQEAKHRKAIRRDITESIEYRRKRAASIAFAGGALLFLMLSPLISGWISRQLMGRNGG